MAVNFVLISLLNHGNTVEREDDGREDEVGEEDGEDEDDGGVLSQGGTAGEDEESVPRYQTPDHCNKASQVSGSVQSNTAREYFVVAGLSWAGKR